MPQQRTGSAWILEEYTTPLGSSRIRRFFSGLTSENKRIARNPLHLLEEFGAELEPPRAKPLGGGLYELRKGEVRIFYTFLPGRRSVIIDGFVKKRDDRPTLVLRDLRSAVRVIHEKEKHKR
jgi:phage-related protein